MTLILFLVTAANTLGQYRIDSWTTDNGLPQNSVTGVAQTPDGYIWFTTNDGLVRFDGVRFRVFTKSNTPEITTNRFSSFFADKNGRLWLQTDDGGILFCDQGLFYVALKPGEVPPGMRSALLQDWNGDLLFTVQNASRAHKYFRYHDGKLDPFVIEGISEQSQLVWADREGGLWVNREGELQRVKDGKIVTYALNGFNPTFTYWTGYEDRDGNLWLACAEGPKHFLLKIRDDKVQSFQLPAPASHLTEDLAGNLLISVQTKGIYRIDKKSVASDEAGANAVELLSLLDGLTQVASGTLCADREGGIWVGTNRGLVRLMPETFRFFSKQTGLPEDNVYPIYEDKAGRIWAGIWQLSLVKYENGGFKTVRNDLAYITSLFEDRGGRMWIGNLGSIYYLDHGKLETFTEQAGFSIATEFSVVAQDKDDNLWFGTSHGLGRYSGSQATVFTSQDGLPDDYIVAFLQTRQGKIWVGTRGGLAAIEDGKIKAFTTADGLAGNYIRSLYEDSDQVLWIGSYDGGLTRLKDGKFTRFTMKDGLLSNGVFCILEDNHGWFWMNSNQGISRVSKQELNEFAEGKTKSLTAIAYGKQDGLLNIEGNGGRQPAGIKARDGKLWFPMAEGIAVVDPETVTSNQAPPPVWIEDIAIDRDPLVDKTARSLVADQSELVLAPNQRNLEIDYTAISFINSSQVKFKYRLEGLDHDWNEVGTRRAAYYPYLPPGAYTFHVIAANRDGIWNTEGARVRVRVLPPFYRTNWFILLSLAVAGCLTLALYQWRVRQVAAQLDRQFEQRLAERTRVAQDLHDTLLQGFLSASMQLHVAAEQIAPDSPAKPTVGRVIKLIGSVIEEGRNALRGLRSSDSAPDDLEHSFARIQQELALPESRSFRVIVEGAPHALHPVIRDEAYRIGREAVVNAVRHSNGTEIEVELEYSSKHLRILVRDNGAGIDPEVLRTGREGHWGMPGMRERAQQIGAKLKVYSRAGAGTEVELTIPAKIAFD